MITFQDASDRAAATYDWVNELLKARIQNLEKGNKESKKKAKRLADDIKEHSLLEDAAYTLMSRGYRSDVLRQAKHESQVIPIDAKLEGQLSCAAVLSQWTFNVLNSFTGTERDLFSGFIAYLANADPNVAKPRSTLKQIRFFDANSNIIERASHYNDVLKSNNTLFELVVGKAISNLTAITEMDDPDRGSSDSKPEFRFNLGEQYWAVECKTVDNQIKSLLDNVKKAWKQVVEEDSHGKQATVGLPIVNVSRLVPDFVPRGGNDEALNGWLEDELTKLRKAFCALDGIADGSFAQYAKSPALSGFLVFAQVPGATLDGQMVTVSRVEWWSASCAPEMPSASGLDNLRSAIAGVGSL